MTTKITTILNSSKLSDFAFFVGLFFLICICFFGSLYNGLYFLLHLERSPLGFVYGRSLFLLFLIFQIIFPQFGKNIVSFILTPLFQIHYLNLEKTLQTRIQKNPFGLFLFFHLFLCLSLLHFFMIYFIGIESFFELLYQVFNIIRLWFFPLVIYLYVVTQLPSRWYSIWDVLVDEKATERLKELVEKSYVFSKESFQKYPKTSRSFLVFFLGIGGGISWGHSTRERVKEIQQVMDFSLSSIDAQAVATNPEFQELAEKLSALNIETTKSPFMISIMDIKNVFQGNSVLADEFGELVKRGVILQKKLQGNNEYQLHKEKLNLLQEKHNLLLLEQAIKKRELGLQKDELGVLGSPAASAIIQKDSPNVSSCLEWFFF